MKFSRMLVISRPLLWLVTGLMYLIGIGNVKNFSALSFVEFLFFLFPLNFYLYGLNDIHDRKSDQINPRKGGVHGALLDMKEAIELKKYVFVPPVLFLGIAGLSKNLEHFLVGLLFVVLAFAYSHPSLKWKEVPFLDVVTSSVGYFCPALLAFTLQHSLSNLTPANMVLILPVAGFHALTTLVDLDCDRKAKMNSVAAFLGKEKTLLFIMGMSLVPLIFWRTALFIGEFIIIMIGCMLLLFLRGKDYQNALRDAGVSFMTIWVVDLLYFFISANL
ncbi:MAG TPA: UbiA family prenyltransferase [Candidatus Nanoarchaeia archaeon]|nr:UbiA family prenyltransferase [Candidatus Nanoarchaeia archaeon]